ncbi:hypothetical protein ACFL20_06545 [Spirochaetota bacterium]
MSERGHCHACGREHFIWGECQSCGSKICMSCKSAGKCPVCGKLHVKSV